MPSVLDLFRLDERVAVVTGASRGLGAAIALGLAEAGADLALLARGDCAETAAAVRATGRRVTVVQTDLARPGAAEAALARATEALGPASILVNNAGTIRRADFIAHSREDWDDTLALNLDAAFELSQAFARACVDASRSGRIINIASMLSFQGGIRVAAYTAAKSALLGLTRALATELAPLGIHVNAIAPGYMATENTAALRADKTRQQAILDRIPAGRWGDPADLVGAAIYLASPASGYVHGAVIPVDGGWLVR